MPADLTLELVRQEGSPCFAQVAVLVIQTMPPFARTAARLSPGKARWHPHPLAPASVAPAPVAPASVAPAPVAPVSVAPPDTSCRAGGADWGPSSWTAWYTLSPTSRWWFLRSPIKQELVFSSFCSVLPASRYYKSCGFLQIDRPSGRKYLGSRSSPHRPRRV